MVITNKMRKKIRLLFLAGIMACIASGCGEESVYTNAEAQQEEAGMPDSAETEDTRDSADAADSTEQGGEEAGRNPEDVGEGQNIADTEPEIDEETRKQLTEELLEENQKDTSVVKGTRFSKGCTFSLPDDFVASEDMAGMYVTKRYPIDASTIYYAVLEQDISLQLMTEETFKAQTEENFRESYGGEVEISIDEFESISIDGYPAFRIMCHYEVDDITISQLEYVINADKSYVITYSQTSEYDRMEEYEASAATIRVE